MGRPAAPLDGRECNDCGEWKSAEGFYLNTSTSTGRKRLSSYCRACTQARNRVSYAKHAPERQVWMRGYRSGLRQQVLDAYGARCLCCGEEGDVFLTIDHVNNDGAEHRRELGSSGGPQFYRDIIERGFPPEFQVLCFNCNMAKHLRGECPHQSALIGNNYSYGRSNF